MIEDPMQRIVITKNGPYVVYGGVPLSVLTIIPDADGGSSEWVEGQVFAAEAVYALCRCGKSSNAPFCDGTHVNVGFDGTETASRQTYDTAKTVIEGPEYVLEDVKAFCAVARFCDAHRSTWDAISLTDDPAVRSLVEHQVSHCPSGRLKLRNSVDGAEIEPDLPVSLGIIEDPAEKCSGPIWARGGLAIHSQDGAEYEKRNRITLCRCGASRNKPFCDGGHVESNYQDGLTK